MENKTSPILIKGIPLQLWCALAILIVCQGVAVGVYLYLVTEDYMEQIALILFLIMEAGILVSLAFWLFKVYLFRRDRGRSVQLGYVGHAELPASVEYRAAFDSVRIERQPIDDDLDGNISPDGVFRGHHCYLCHDSISEEALAMGGANDNRGQVGLLRCCSRAVHVDCVRRFFDQVDTVHCPSCGCTEFDSPCVLPEEDVLSADTPVEPSHARCAVCSEIFDQSTMQVGVAMCCFATMHSDCALRRNGQCPVCSTEPFPVTIVPRRDAPNTDNNNSEDSVSSDTGNDESVSPPDDDPAEQHDVCPICWLPSVSPFCGLTEFRCHPNAGPRLLTRTPSKI